MDSLIVLPSLLFGRGRGVGQAPQSKKGIANSGAGFHGKMESPTMEARSSLLPVVGDGMTP